MLVKTALSLAELQEAAQRIKTLRRAATEQAIEIGRELLRVKDSLPHGAFVRWVERSCEFKIRTAQDLMKLAREADQSANLVALMVPSTLRVYLSKKTSATVRSTIVKRLENGDRISRSELYSETLNPKSGAKVKQCDVPVRTDFTSLLFRGPDLVRTDENKTDREDDRSRIVAELIIRRLSREDYEFIMEEMNWGVWNRCLVWMRASRVIDSEHIEFIGSGSIATPTQSPISNRQ
jgi:hypothetical protein